MGELIFIIEVREFLSPAECVADDLVRGGGLLEFFGRWVRVEGGLEGGEKFVVRREVTGSGGGNGLFDEVVAGNEAGVGFFHEGEVG